MIDFVSISDFKQSITASIIYIKRYTNQIIFKETTGNTKLQKTHVIARAHTVLVVLKNVIITLVLIHGFWFYFQFLTVDKNIYYMNILRKNRLTFEANTKYTNLKKHTLNLKLISVKNAWKNSPFPTFCRLIQHSI